MSALIGQRFGRLIVVSQADSVRTPSGQVQTRWNCICDCGNTSLVRRSNLRNTKSCGCWNAEQIRLAEHGHARRSRRTSEYDTWCEMHQRCTNPKNRSYVNYGGRGISVCSRWASFENFIADMGPRPPRHSIDRINNDGNYEPSNCRWATHSQQNANKRKERKAA